MTRNRYVLSFGVSLTVTVTLPPTVRIFPPLVMMPLETRSAPLISIFDMISTPTGSAHGHQRKSASSQAIFRPLRGSQGARAPGADPEIAIRRVGEVALEGLQRRLGVLPAPAPEDPLRLVLGHGEQ